MDARRRKLVVHCFEGKVRVEKLRGLIVEAMQLGLETSFGEVVVVFLVGTFVF